MDYIAGNKYRLHYGIDDPDLRGVPVLYLGEARRVRGAVPRLRVRLSTSALSSVGRPVPLDGRELDVRWDWLIPY
jgi:hypothetical protein